MAYFLDPELAALVNGGNRKAPAATATAPRDTGRTNKYGKRCDSCNTWVPAAKGYLSKVGNNWVVYCMTCP